MIQSVWPVFAGAVMLGTLVFFRVLSVFSERQITRHNVIREARRMRQGYLQNRLNQLPTGEWEVVDE